jgi:hypothetical protein
MHTAEPPVSVISHIEVEIAIVKLKKYSSPGSDQILTELIQGAAETLVSMIHRLTNSISDKKELVDEWKESISVPIHKKGASEIKDIASLSCRICVAAFTLSLDTFYTWRCLPDPV